jgi:hypothetical protein
MKLLYDTAEVGLDFREVLNGFSSLSLKEVVRECDTLLAHLDADSAQIRPGDIRLAASLRSFLFFLNLGRFYTNLARQEAPLYRPVITALVQRNELKRTFLETVDREIASILAQKLLPSDK